MKTTNNNYQIAWDLLERRYANERLVAQEHVYAVLKFPVITKASHTHLRELIDMLTTNIEALRMSKVQVGSWDAIHCSDYYNRKIGLSFEKRMAEQGRSIYSQV
jgi:hypothetical protein